MKRVSCIVGCVAMAMVVVAAAGSASAQTTAVDRADRQEAAAAAHAAPPPPPPAPAPSMGSGGGSSASGGSGGFAVPRGPGERGAVGGRRVGGERPGLNVVSEDQQRRGGNVSGVPPYSRPRPSGQPATGTAAPRRTPPPTNRDGGGIYYYPTYYYPYGGYGYGYGGYGSYYDPFFWAPFGYGYGSYFGIPYGFGGYGYDGFGYGGYAYGGGGGGRLYREAGAIRLKVKPEAAQVFVDGYYAGTVDDYDGIFQRLNLSAGAHRIEIRAAGYQSHSFEVQIVPGETITYRGDLVR